MPFLSFYSKNGVLQKTFSKFSTINELKYLLIASGVPSSVDHYFIVNSHLLQDPNHDIPSGSHVHAVPKIIGGKGGFGSMLRAIGAQIEKTTSREACRDLSGRRMRDVNNEKNLKEWIGKEADRERERAQRRHERMERRRNQPKHNFEDETYHEHRMKIADNLEDALQEGLNKKKLSKAPATVTQSTLSRKRASDEPVPSSSKMKCEWIGIDLESASDIDTDEDSNSDSEGGARASPILSLDSESTSSSLFESNTFTSVTTTSCASTDTECGSKEQNTLPLSNDSCCNLADVDNSGDINGFTKDTSKEKSPDNTVEASGMLSPTEKLLKNSLLCQNEPPTTDSKRSNEDENSSQKVACLNELTPKSQGLLNMLSSVPPSKDEACVKVSGPIKLEEYQSAADLEELGLDVLKSELMSRGLKCGGTLQQRAERLFTIKGLKEEQIHPSLFAKSSSSKGGRKNKS